MPLALLFGFQEEEKLAHVHHDESGEDREYGNIPTGALNFLPRRDMFGRDSVGRTRGSLRRMALWD